MGLIKVLEGNGQFNKLRPLIHHSGAIPPQSNKPRLEAPAPLEVTDDLVAYHGEGFPDIRTAQAESDWRVGGGGATRATASC